MRPARLPASPSAVLALAARALAPAGRTCTTSPLQAATRRATSSPTSGRRGPRARGTVARGQLRADAALYTGKAAGISSRRFPWPSTSDAPRCAASERYNIYCAPCHGRRGAGTASSCGAAIRQPPSFHDRPAARRARPGYFFDVMTSGFGAMPDYAAQIAGRRTAGRSWPTSGRSSSARTPPSADVPAERRGELDVGTRRGRGDTGAAPEWTSMTARHRHPAARRPGPAARLVAAAAGHRRAASLGLPGPAEQFFRSYLFGYLFWIGIALGCLGLADDPPPVGRRVGPRDPAHPGGGRAHRSASSRSSSCPWPWASRASTSGRSPRPRTTSPAAQEPYLNVPFFLGRAAFYFLVWCLLAHFLNKWSLEMDRGAELPASPSGSRPLRRRPASSWA